MSTHAQPLVLTIPSDPSLLGLVRAFVEAVCHLGRLQDADRDAIVLATNEAASNVMRHAHCGRPDAMVRIECCLGEDRMEIHLHDDGEPFDLESVPRLDPAEVRVGGRGIFLMRSLMDELTCQPRGERGNILRMVKRCRFAPEPRECG